MNDQQHIEFSYFFGKCRLTVDGETIAFKGPGLRSGSVRRSTIVAWALNDATNDLTGVHHDWNMLPRLGAQGEIFFAYKSDPTASPKLARVPIDVFQPACREVVQRLWAEMPERFRGMGSGKALRTAVGASDMGRQVVLASIALAIVGVGLGGLLYLANS